MSRHSVTRFYANDTVAVLNSYSDAIWTDRSGQVTLFTQRTSITVIKIDGKWLVVDQHNSRMP